MKSNNNHIIDQLKKGYCLWIGNGITIYLSTISNNSFPSWSELVEKLEEENDIKENGDLNYPQRLKIIRNRVKKFEFQKLLREKIHNNLAMSIFKGVKKIIDSKDIVPVQIRNIAKLGMLANPIVNFNIETISSWALARAGGPFVIKSFNPNPDTIKKYISSGTKIDDKFQRSVFHPHGALDHYGTCVMTVDEYKSSKGTLAFQLAVHSSFMTNLVIVGMSLEDEYLRNQIQEFRQQIKKIFYFTDDASKEIKRWALLNDVEIIEMSWEEFWKNIVPDLPTPKEESMLWTLLNIIQRLQVISNGASKMVNMIEDFKELGAREQNLTEDYQLATNRGIDIKDFDKSPLIPEVSLIKIEKKIYNQIISIR